MNKKCNSGYFSVILGLIICEGTQNLLLPDLTRSLSSTLLLMALIFHIWHLDMEFFGLKMEIKGIWT